MIHVPATTATAANKVLLAFIRHPRVSCPVSDETGQAIGTTVRIRVNAVTAQNPPAPSRAKTALSPPRPPRRWATTVIQNVLADGLSDERAVQNVVKICPPGQLEGNLELLAAFLDFNAERRYCGFRIFDEFAGKFLTGPDVEVPVRPTAILNDGGVLKPLFVIGWATNTLKYYQRRLLASVYEDAIYSLTDLRESPGEVLLFPRNAYGVRTVDRWERGSYQLLSRPELREQVERFVLARSEARPIIAHRYRLRAERKAQEEEARRAAEKPGYPPKP